MSFQSPVTGNRSQHTGNPAVDCLRDDVVEWTETLLPEMVRQRDRLRDAEAALARGQTTTVLYLIKTARTHQGFHAESVAKLQAKLSQP